MILEYRFLMIPFHVQVLDVLVVTYMVLEGLFKGSSYHHSININKTKALCVPFGSLCLDGGVDLGTCSRSTVHVYVYFLLYCSLS